jgi:serine/threonine-protein kinase
MGASEPPIPQAADPLIGLVVDSFEIQSLIGEGSMGHVYRGVHTVIGKPVAIKVLKAEFAQDAEMVQRLIREARAVNAIKHPGIVDVFGFGTLPQTNQPFIVMDLLEGEPLDALLGRAAPLPLKTIFPILDELLVALAAAHEVGVIHRDLKPGNVFLERQPEGRQRARLLDFGLARQAQRSGGSIAPTRPGMLMGTPAFMAPEQILGEKVGPQTDLYALGGIAYQMATGHFPHEAASSMEILSLKLRADPPPPTRWNSQLPAGFERWVMELLTREFEQRPRSADEVRERLALLREPRRNSGVQPRVVDARESASQNEPKTVLYDREASDEAAPPEVRPNVESLGSMPETPGTRLLWRQEAAEDASRINTFPGATPLVSDEGSASPVPLALIIALGTSVLAISAGLWWLFNS